MSDIYAYKELHNAYDMLEGCLNRLNVTDDPDEVEQMYNSALYHLSIIKKLQTKRIQDMRESDSDYN